MRIADLSKKIALALQSLAVVLGLGAGSLALAAPVLAATCDQGNLTIDSGAACGKGTSAKENLFATNGVFVTIANTLIFVVGAVAVLYLIIGGLRYVVSNGDSKSVEAAKNTILYAIIGIVVAVVSFALVKFVIDALNKAT